MRTLRFLALVSLSALLSGCGTFCPPPGDPGFVNEKPCSYFMKVQKLYPPESKVTATISTRVEGENIDYNHPYTFHVDGLERLTSTGQVQVGKEYLFFNAHNGPTLEVFPKGSDPIAKSDPITK